MDPKGRNSKRGIEKANGKTKGLVLAQSICLGLAFLSYI
jgi:hypothetical protein